jgi:hypothetical protein
MWPSEPSDPAGQGSVPFPANLGATHGVRGTGDLHFFPSSFRTTGPVRDPVALRGTGFFGSVRARKGFGPGDPRAILARGVLWDNG